MKIHLKMMTTSLVALGMIAGLAGTAAAVPGTMSFTARLTEGGQPVEGNVSLEVELYDAPADGTLLWEETHPSVMAERGLVFANLGSIDPVGNSLDGTVFDGQPVYAQLIVDGDRLSPRIPLTSVPYAVRAGVADTLEGFDPGDVITGVTAGTGLTGGGASGAVTLSVDPAVVQTRVTGTCGAGTFMTGVGGSGTVTCGNDAVGTGDITGVTAGAGLTGGGTSGAVTLTVDTGAIQARVTGTCTPGQFMTGVASTGAVVCAADSVGTGDITGVTAGTGLTGGGTSGAVTLTVDTNAIQARVTGTCTPGQFMTGVSSTGGVVCAADSVGTGDITGVTAGAGLSGGGTGGTVTLTVDTNAIQARVTGTCSPGQFMTGVSSTGGAICAADAVGGTGDVTSVAAGTGLTGGGTMGDLTVSIAPLGVGTAQLADNAVNTNKIAPGAVTTADIATGAVTMSRTEAPAGQATALMANGSFVVYPATESTTETAGQCFVTAQAITLGTTNVAGFRVRPVVTNAANASFTGTAWGYSTAVNVGPVAEFPNGTSGREATASGLVDVTGAAPWRFGCEIQGNQNSITCSVAYTCN